MSGRLNTARSDPIARSVGPYCLRWLLVDDPVLRCAGHGGGAAASIVDHVQSVWVRRELASELHRHRLNRQ